MSFLRRLLSYGNSFVVLLACEVVFLNVELSMAMYSIGVYSASGMTAKDGIDSSSGVQSSVISGGR